MMIGNVICLPKSGSSFLHSILPGSVHEFDHKDISLLSLNQEDEGLPALARYYLFSRSQLIPDKIDIATSKVFLIPFIPSDECLLPTLFLIRDPMHWSRSILSYSLDVARVGDFHEWVRLFQKRFVGDCVLAKSDLFDSASLSRSYSVLQPKLLELWCSVHQKVLDHLLHFPNSMFLTTDQLSQSVTKVLDFFYPSASHQAPDRLLTPVNQSSPSSTINHLVTTYFQNIPALPSAIDASILHNYIQTLRQHSFS